MVDKTPKITKCPFCRKLFNVKLIENFYFCKNCEVAIREEKDMPVFNYNKNWVKSQIDSRQNLNRAGFTLKQIKKIPNIKTILDIGCGTGILVDILNRNGYLADGVDSSVDSINYAKVHRKGNFYLSSIENFKKNRDYDLIIATQLIEHLRDPNIFLLNVKRILRPKGYLYIETPNLNSWSKKSIWRRRIGGMYYGKDHRILYTNKSLTNLLRNNSFVIYKVFSKTFSPTILVETAYTSIFTFRKKSEFLEKPSIINPPINRENKNLFINILKKIYEQTKDSFIINMILFIPNKISGINSRGNQLIVIARNNNNE